MRQSIDWPLVDLLGQRARTTPDATAVVDAADGRAWTYAELDRLVAGFAADLATAIDGPEPASRGDGLSGEDRPTGDRPCVVVTARTDPRFVVALFATWRAGGQVVPVDGDSPRDALGVRLDRLDPSLVVTGEPEAPPWDGTACPTLSPDGIDLTATRQADADGEAAHSPREPWSPDEPALVLFTSGTTGAPKGVQLTHGNLVSSAVGSALRLGLDTGERWFDCLPTSHMGGLAPMVRSVLYGTTVVLQSEFDTQSTADAVASHDATAISLVPTQLRRLLEVGWTPPETLRFVLLGGAPAGTDLIEACEAAGVPVCPTYGSTETASQIATAAPGEAFEYPDSVGNPLLVADVTLLERETGTPVEEGTVGELAIDGPIVSPGYLDDAATAAAFGPFGLRTGDLASRDEAGRLRIHGRVDDAIQTGGETVHPWRVAEALEAHPGVAAAAVVGLPDPEWGERVAAMVVRDGTGALDGVTVDEETLRAYVRERLEDYAVPKTIRVVDALPRTDSGTIDRRAVRRRFLE